MAHYSSSREALIAGYMRYHPPGYKVLYAKKCDPKVYCIFRVKAGCVCSVNETTGQGVGNVGEVELQK